MDSAKYAALFLSESREHLGACNGLLLDWERTPAATEPVGGMFRAVHTIKGMAATMGYDGVADLAHRAENLLDGMRGGRVAPTGAIFELLFRTVDALSAGVEAAAAGADVLAEPSLLAALDRAAAGGGATATAVIATLAPTLPTSEVAPSPRHATRQIRIDLRRLDTWMRQVGELVVARNRLGALAAALDDPALTETSARIARLATEMQHEVIAARMTPVGEIFERFPRLVRDLARDLDKQIRCDIEGGDIELDRSVLDEVGEPLLHLVRNAADHGIEPPAARRAAGKPAEGRIVLSATRDRNTVAIRVTDDGRGIDREAILVKAKRDGLADADATALDDDGLIRVLSRPGFSTARAVSDVSGRGVGVDVAMTRVRALGGTLDVRSEPGNGTTFILRVPLTLAIVRALLTEVGGERYALPLAYVAETVEIDPAALTSIRGRDALVLRDEVVPTVHLRDLVASAPAVPALDDPSGTRRRRRPAVIVEVGERRTGLMVDAVIGQQELVVEPFDAPSGMFPVIGGATILTDGVPALILDAAAIL